MKCDDCQGRRPCHADANVSEPYFTCIWCYTTLKNTCHRWIVHTSKCPKRPNLPSCICFDPCQRCLRRPSVCSKKYVGICTAETATQVREISTHVVTAVGAISKEKYLKNSIAFHMLLNCVICTKNGTCKNKTYIPQNNTFLIIHAAHLSDITTYATFDMRR